MNRRKLVLASIFLLILPLLLVGCHKTIIHPGALNQFDSNAYDSLIVAQAAIDAAKAQPSITNNVMAKAALNKAIGSYNIAYEAYLAYHAGVTKDNVALQTALAQAIVDIANFQKTVPAPIGGAQ